MTCKCIASGEIVFKGLNFNTFVCYWGRKVLLQKAVQKGNSVWNGLFEYPTTFRRLQVLTFDKVV